MKKGTKIKLINIGEDGQVTVTDEKGESVKCTYSQRTALCNFKNPDYFRNVSKAFGGVDILSDGFQAYKHGKLVKSK